MNRIERFVRGYIRNKTLDVGYASALEVAHKPEGDCTEHVDAVGGAAAERRLRDLHGRHARCQWQRIRACRQRCQIEALRRAGALEFNRIRLVERYAQHETAFGLCRMMSDDRAIAVFGIARKFAMRVLLAPRAGAGGATTRTRVRQT